MSFQEPRSTVSRRSLLHAAWAAPVLVAATATPAGAASQSGVVSISLVADPAMSVYVGTVLLDGAPFPGSATLEARITGTNEWFEFDLSPVNSSGQALFSVTPGDQGVDMVRATVEYDSTAYYSNALPYLGLASVATTATWSGGTGTFAATVLTADGTPAAFTIVMLEAFHGQTETWYTLVGGATDGSGTVTLTPSSSLALVRFVRVKAAVADTWIYGPVFAVPVT